MTNFMHSLTTDPDKVARWVAWSVDAYLHMKKDRCSAKQAYITISIPGVPDVALRKNRGSTTHWDRQREARTMRDNAAMLILEQIGTKRPHYPTAGVCITQYYCGRPLDYEALASGMGPAIDAFIDCHIIEDDRPDRYLLDYQLRYVRVDHKDLVRVEITMRDMTDAAWKEVINGTE